jgi:Protein of unknown function (DUF2847).
MSEEPEFLELLKDNRAFLLFKHSLTCPISQKAFQEFRRYSEKHPEVPAYYLAVQESRPLSNLIAEYYSIRHESPQIFYVRDGKVKWHCSHGDITETAIGKVMNHTAG